MIVNCSYIPTGDPVFHHGVLPVPAGEDTTVLPETSTNSPARPAVTTTRRPPPKPEPGCALAYDPFYSTGDPEVGYRFGKTTFEKKNTHKSKSLCHKLDCITLSTKNRMRKIYHSMTYLREHFSDIFHHHLSLRLLREI